MVTLLSLIMFTPLSLSSLVSGRDVVVVDSVSSPDSPLLINILTINSEQCLPILVTATQCLMQY